MAYELLDEGLVRPNAQAAALRSAADNDAAVVGLAQSLEVPDSFRGALARMRPEVATHGRAAMAAQLAGQDRTRIPLLQRRADDGLVAAKPWAEKIGAAKTDANRLSAMKDFQASEVAAHASDDSAYSVGVAEALWAVGARDRRELSSSAYDSLFTAASTRLDSARPATVVRG